MDGKTGKKMKIKWAHACGSLPKQQHRYDQDMENSISQFHPIKEAVNKTWDFLIATHEWIQQCSMELQDSKITDKVGVTYHLLLEGRPVRILGGTSFEECLVQVKGE